VSDLSSRSSSPFGEVLRLAFPEATFTRTGVATAIDCLKIDFPWVLDEQELANDRYQVLREASDCLLGRARRYGLPAPAMTHLFWGLYWYSKLSGRVGIPAHRLRKLARHLLDAAMPGSLAASPSSLSVEATERHVEAVLWAARELLAASLPGDVPALLLRAARAVRREDHKARLRSLTWRAYALLGDDDLFALLLRQHGDTAGKRAVSTEAASLFVDSLRLPDQSLETRANLVGRLASLPEEIRAYAEMRGLLLALTLNPVVHGGQWSMFVRVAREAAPKTMSAVRGALVSQTRSTRPTANLARRVDLVARDLQRAGSPSPMQMAFSKTFDFALTNSPTISTSATRQAREKTLSYVLSVKSWM
jgi:hypothetical protein